MDLPLWPGQQENRTPGCPAGVGPGPTAFPASVAQASPLSSPTSGSEACGLHAAMAAKQPPPLMKKHSQTDLVSRLKTRKILGVGGEDDDGEVHRSKVRGTGSPSVRRDIPGPTLGCSMLFPAVMRPLLQEGSQQICEMSSAGPPQHMDKPTYCFIFPQHLSSAASMAKPGLPALPCKGCYDKIIAAL